MTLERFQEMDLTDFKESIRRWLKEKETRLDNYYSIGLNSTRDNVTSQNVDEDLEIYEEPIVTN